MQPVEVQHLTPVLDPGLAPDQEQEQPLALHQHEVVETPPEEANDRIARLAAALCDTPYAFVTLDDRDGKSCRAMVGLDEGIMSQEGAASFCRHASEGTEVMVVEDASRDPRFTDDPSVAGEPHLRFYAGAPLRSADGHGLGVLSVADARVRTLTPEQLTGLADLASVLTAQLEQRHRACSYRELFTEHPVAMWISDVETLRILEVNDFALKRYGYSREQFLSLRITDLRPAADVPAFLRHLASTPQWGRTGPFRHVRADGSLLYVEISHQPITYQGHAAQLVMAHDITEQVTWKRAHQVTEERFSLLVEAVDGYAIVLLDPVGRVISWNKGAHRLYGFEERKAIGRSAGEFFPEDAAGREDFTERVRAGAQGGAFQIEARQQRADGSTFWADILLTPLKDEKGHALGFVQITHDITLRRDYEQTLIEERERAQRLNEITSRHLINISRDLRTPLTGIIGAAEVLSAEVGGDLGPFVESVHRNGQYLLETIETALEYVQLTGLQEHLPLEEVDLRAEALAAAQRYGPRAAELDLSLEVDVPAEPIPALGHADVLERVLGQLIRNALKFTPDGNIVVRATVDAAGPLIEVEDTGIGMSSAFLESVFEPFTQEDPNYGRPLAGSGLGLPIVHRQVERMGGRISVWSEKDAGSRFTVRLLVGDETE